MPEVTLTKRETVPEVRPVRQVYLDTYQITDLNEGGFFSRESELIKSEFLRTDYETIHHDRVSKEVRTVDLIEAADIIGLSGSGADGETISIEAIELEEEKELQAAKERFLGLDGELIVARNEEELALIRKLAESNPEVQIKGVIIPETVTVSEELAVKGFEELRADIGLNASIEKLELLDTPDVSIESTLREQVSAVVESLKDEVGLVLAEGEALASALERELGWNTSEASHVISYSSTEELEILTADLGPVAVVSQKEDSLNLKLVSSEDLALKELSQLGAPTLQLEPQLVPAITAVFEDTLGIDADDRLLLLGGSDEETNRSLELAAYNTEASIVARPAGELDTATAVREINPTKIFVSDSTQLHEVQEVIAAFPELNISTVLTLREADVEAIPNISVTSIEALFVADIDEVPLGVEVKEEVNSTEALLSKKIVTETTIVEDFDLAQELTGLPLGVDFLEESADNKEERTEALTIRQSIEQRESAIELDPQAEAIEV